MKKRREIVRKKSLLLDQLTPYSRKEIFGRKVKKKEGRIARSLQIRKVRSTILAEQERIKEKLLLPPNPPNSIREKMRNLRRR